MHGLLHSLFFKANEIYKPLKLVDYIDTTSWEGSNDSSLKAWNWFLMTLKHKSEIRYTIVITNVCKTYILKVRTAFLFRFSL
jgi:hypothetical protein